MSTRKGRYGDGSITLRKDGRYCARYKGKCAYAKSEAEAVTKLRELRKEVDTDNLPPIRRKLDDYYRDWAENDRRKVWKPTTFDLMETIYRCHVKDALGGFQMGQIDARDIQRVLDEQAEESASYAIARGMFKVFLGLFGHAYLMGDIPQNPMDRVRRLRKKDYEKSKPVEFLEPDEVARLEAVAAKRNGNGKPLHKHGNLIVFLVNTGLRRGELLGLKWEDIDFENKTVQVVGNWISYRNPDKSADAPKRISERGTPKTEDSQRTVPLNKKALAALRQYESDWGRTSEYISITSKGKQIDSSSLDETLRRMATEAGITKKVHLHMLRHTFASRALSPEIGVDVGTVSKWLGHSSITITYNVYVHVLASTENRAAALLEAM